MHRGHGREGVKHLHGALSIVVYIRSPATTLEFLDVPSPRFFSAMSQDVVFEAPHNGAAGPI